MSIAKPRLVVLGSGWGGFELLRGIDHKQYDVSIVSPSTCVGTLEFRRYAPNLNASVTEPIRRSVKAKFEYYQAFCEHINFSKKILECRSSLDSTTNAIPFDHLVIAVGARSNTFNIPGVHEHALFLKDISDARRIRHRVLECFEKAKFPGASEERIKQLLHFCVVGGGPTGIEFSAELYDFIAEDLRLLYPDLFRFVRITVYDVASRILSGFDASLAEYAVMKFSRQGIHIRTGTGVAEVTLDKLMLNDGEAIETGMIVWATGLAPNTLIASMEGVQKEGHSGRLLTDSKLRLLDSFGKSMGDIYAFGDCATIVENDLPCTAQVAKQKAKYLRSVLNGNKSTEQAAPFVYRSAGSMAYIGGWKAIVDLRMAKHSVRQRGWVAWLFWRSAYFSMAVSWRNKLLIPMYWFLTWAFGRDTSQI